MNSKETVKMLLVKYPTLKDSDSRLIANFWNEELKGKGFDIKEMKAVEFLNMFSKSKLTNPETIRRNRAKLQEEHPELRGEIYRVRQGKEQEKWREELGYHIKGINKL
jgi:hypothetical protein